MTIRRCRDVSVRACLGHGLQILGNAALRPGISFRDPTDPLNTASIPGPLNRRGRVKLNR
jgi:hypothetical protein